MAPTKRNPAPLAGGSRVGIDHVGTSIFSDITTSPRCLQAARVRSRWAVSWPLAVTIAEHAFGGREQG